MQRAIFVSIFLLTVVNLAHCQEWENLLFIKMEVLLEKQEAALVKQEAALSQLKGMQEKQEQVEGKLQEMQEKLQHVEINLQEFHHELEHMKGAVNSNQDSLQKMQKMLGSMENNLHSAVNNTQDSLQNISAKLEKFEEIHQETKGCLGREDLEHFKNISSAGQEELESLLRQEISGVISLLETGGMDECSEGSHNCTDYEACTNKFVDFTCSCLSGFTRDGSRCEDIDECAQGKDECSPLATCRNSVGSYSCSCNPPSEGDGRSCSCPRGFAQKGSKCEDIDECTEGKAKCSPQATCRNSVGSYSCSCNPPFEGDGRTCEFPCESEAKYIEGLGCVKLVKKDKTFVVMNATCHQAGGRLLQDFSVERLLEVVRTFGHGGWRRWVGVREGKWLESGLPLQEELWMEGSRGSDPSGRKGLCGVSDWDSSSSYKVGQLDCSEERFGYCQILIPQK